MKKKILFIISNMESGGVSKSMSTLLNIIDKDKYEIDVFITNPVGVFREHIPSAVNIIADKKTQLIFSNFPQNLILILKKGYIFTFCLRLMSAVLMIFNKGIGAWLLSRCIYRINKEYDVAVDYNGQHQLYYLVDFIKAKKKVSFFHSDYSKWDYYYYVDKKYYPKVDTIYTVSHYCVGVMKKFFPSEKGKIELMENIISVTDIDKKSALDEKDLDKFEEKTLNILTIGHVSNAKGSDLAIKAAKALKNANIKFKWFFIGTNKNSSYYNKMVSDLNLNGEIFFLGVKSNPYPFLKKTDFYVHPSQFEGKSIALDEAKLFCKPIIVTNFSSVQDQFTNRENASIVNMDFMDLSKGIIELMEDESLKKHYVKSLERERVIYEKSDLKVEKIFKY